MSINGERGKASATSGSSRARFRRQAFGWKSEPAIKRVKEAVSEIKKAARKDKVLDPRLPAAPFRRLYRASTR